VNPTIYTLIMSLAWCSIFIVISTLLKQNKHFLRNYGIIPMTALLVASLFRLFSIIEFPFTQVYRSNVFLPMIVDGLQYRMAFRTINISVASVFLCIWILGIIIQAIKLLLGEIWKNRFISGLLKNCMIKTCKFPMSSFFSVIKHQNYSLFYSDEVSSPLITGYFTPTIVIPNIPWSEEELTLCIEHELNHFLYKDLWIKGLINVVCAIFWWNPFVYILKKDMDSIFEIRSDLKVVSNLDEHGKVEYLKLLVKVAKYAKLRKDNDIGGVIGFASTAKSESQLEYRLKMILTGQSKWKRTYTTMLSATMLLLLLVSYSFVVQPYSLPPDADEGIVAISPENSYIIAKSDGTYELCINDDLYLPIDESSLDSDPHVNLKIIQQEG